MKQSIRPERAIFYAGDTVTFILCGLKGRAGRAVLRTTIGRAAVRRRELIEFNEKGSALLGMEWHDIEMDAAGDGGFSLTLPLVEVGVFEAKCCCATPQCRSFCSQSRSVPDAAAPRANSAD